MKFQKITEMQYRRFWEKSEQRHFLSAPEIGHFDDRRTVDFYGVFNGEKILAAAMVLGTKRRFFGYDFYIPRGFLADYDDKNLVSFFVKNLKQELTQKGGYVLRIEPNVELVERDIDGEIVAGGYDNRYLVKSLEKLGFLRVKYVEGVSNVRWEFVLPTKGKTREDIISGMKPNTRRRLKQAEDLGIAIKDLEREEIRDFYEILTATADRKKFKARDLAYFEKIYDLFHEQGEVKFVSAVVKPKECIKKMMEQRELILKEDPKTIREKRDHDDAVKSIDVRIKRAQEIFEKTQEDEIALSSGVFFVIGKEILHFAGGNASEYIKLDGQYLLQWEMIGRAIDSGCDRYNFYGLVGNDENYIADGVYEFKRGFGGKVVQRIGEFELPLSSKFYLRKFLKKSKQVLKK